MNREIKFRAWDREDKKFFTPKPTFNSMSISITLNGEIIGHPNVGEVTSHYDLMQYTGLKDKNNKEIYEGDVVMIDHWKSSDLFDYSKPFSVEYYEGEINFKQGIYNNMKGSLQGKLITEIIGNIYETPHLLNGRITDTTIH
jgi:uncharacterized phage protein (TIGR01671 family)